MARVLEEEAVRAGSSPRAGCYDRQAATGSGGYRNSRAKRAFAGTEEELR